MSSAATKKRHTTHPTKSRAVKTNPRAKGTTRRTTTARKTGATRARRNYQAAPTPERYKEIQQALASKGYFKGEVNGTWGPDSIEALRRFQGEQNLEPDGKIGSLSLIALGLGPKRITAQARPEQQTVVPDRGNQPTQSKQ